MKPHLSKREGQWHCRAGVLHSWGFTAQGAYLALQDQCRAINRRAGLTA